MTRLVCSRLSSAVLACLLSLHCGGEGSLPPDGELGADGSDESDDAQSVQADHAGERQSALAFTQQFQPFTAKEFDTGWLGRDKKVQVRFTVKLASLFRTSAPGTAWLAHDGSTITYEGKPGAGSIAMDIGLQVSGRLKLQLEVPVVGTVDWEGDLPLNPQFDFRFTDEQTFTPFLLEGAAERPVHLADEIGEMQLFHVPVPGLGIPFVAGGEVVILAHGRIEAELVGDYLQTQADGQAPLRQTQEGEANAWPGGEGQVSYQATLKFKGSIVLSPGASFNALGEHWTLARLPVGVDLGQIGLPSYTIRFAPQPLAFAPAPTVN